MFFLSRIIPFILLTWLTVPAISMDSVHRVLILGNSITRHGPAPAIGWFGDWGMAASDSTKDYVHLLDAKFKGLGKKVSIYRDHIGTFETAYRTYDYTLLSKYVAYDPDLIILKFGENVANDSNLTYFKTQMARLLDSLTQGRHREIIICGTFWNQEFITQLLRETALSRQYPFVELSYLSNDPSNMATGLFTNPGVAAHPGDKGMAAIADIVWQRITSLVGRGPVRVGAIRWDAWIGPPHFAGIAVEKSLGPNHWHYRLPFYAVEGDNTVQIRETTQAIIDSQLVLAKSAGIDYFAYVLYYDAMKTARDLHMSSAHKSDVKFCWIMDGNAFTGWPTPLTFLKTSFADSDYVRVADNRPLVYIFGGSGTATQISQLDSASRAAGLGSPYFVDMGTGLGSQASAHSLYAIGGSSYSGTPFSNLMSQCRDSWDDHARTIPLVSAGWDPMPRVENPVSWTSYDSSHYQKATPGQIAALLQDAVNFVAADPSRCEANSALIYGWNEFDEGGWICPNLAAYGGSERLDAVRTVDRDPDIAVTSLAGYWKFDGNLNDELGYNNGTAQGGVTYETGKTGQAVKLNGTNGGVSINDNGRLNVTQVTLSVWLKLAALPAQNVTIGKDGSYRLAISASGNAHLAVATSASSWYAAGTTANAPAGSIKAGEWIHLAGTYDGTRTRIFINGDSVGAGSAISGSLVSNSTPLQIGISTYSNIDWMNGSVDEMKVLSTALSPADIRALYQSIAGGSTSTALSAPPVFRPFLYAAPNPFNPTTKIQYRLSKPSTARYTLFDSCGRILRQYLLQTDLTGTLVWDGRDSNGRAVGTGLYIGKLEAADGTLLSHRLMLLR